MFEKLEIRKADREEGEGRVEMRPGTAVAASSALAIDSAKRFGALLLPSPPQPPPLQDHIG